MIHYDKGVIKEHGFAIRVEPLQETIYRYRAINEWLRAILVDDEIYFSTPKEFNDPFDCRFEASLDEPLQGIEETLKENQIFAQVWQKGENLGWGLQLPEGLASLAQMSEEEVQIYAKEIYLNRGYNSIEFQREHKAKLEAIRNHIGVCCFAGRGNDYLMFAHYGDQHRGCCLEFQIRDENGERQSIFKDGFILNDVVYDDEPPSVPIFHPLSALLKIIMTKHSRWSYEEEIRFVKASGSGPAIYHREKLSGIIFGYRTSDSDIAKVLGWLGQRNNINLFRAVPNQLSSLDLVPLDI